MGNSQQVSEYNSNYVKLMTRYTKQAIKHDEFFGQVILYKDKQVNKNILTKQDDSKIIVKSYNCNSDEDYKNISKCLQQRRAIKHNNLLPILGINREDFTNMCSDSHRVSVAIEYLDESLDKELETRLEINAYYEEIYLWIFLSQMIDVLSYLQEHQLFHGDVRPKNIYLDELGAVIISDHQLLPNLNTGYTKVMRGTNQQVYLAPELLYNLNSKDLQPCYSPYKADVYSLGMTMLEMATLYKSCECYDFQTLEIQNDIIDGRIRLMQQGGYSPLLIDLVKDLLNADHNLRPDFFKLQVINFLILLKDNITKYKLQINEMQPFWNLTKLNLQNLYQSKSNLMTQPIPSQQQSRFVLPVNEGSGQIQYSDQGLQNSLNNRAGSSQFQQSRMNYPQNKEFNQQQFQQNQMISQRMVIQQNQAQQLGSNLNNRQNAQPIELRKQQQYA